MSRSRARTIGTARFILVVAVAGEGAIFIVSDEVGWEEAMKQRESPAFPFPGAETQSKSNLKLIEYVGQLAAGL